MPLLNTKFKGVIAAFAVITLFSCQDDFNKVRNLSLASNDPVGIGENANAIHTDSGKVVANLLAPKFLDFSNKKFTYSEFPEGVTVYFYEDDKTSTITADYAIRYDQKGLVDLRGNVVLFTSDSTELLADQVYWDQNENWIFSDSPYRIKFNDGSYNDGSSFDSNKDFTTFLSRKNTGVQLIDNENPTNDDGN